LNSQGATIVIVTHDVDVANKCSRIIEITDGRILVEEE
jgi:putative ABC transport system ATP-binding protein